MSSPGGRAADLAGLLNRLLAGQDLTSADTAWAMREVMTGEATPVQVAAFAVALRAKGESAEEVAGLAAEMLAQATPVQIPVACVDIVGTGGDGAHTVNISTMAAVVAAAAGAPVAKHGGRAASSSSGAADVLEELGVAIDLPAAGGRPLRAGGRHRLLLRAGLPPGHALRRRPAAGDGHRAPSSTSWAR